MSFFFTLGFDEANKRKKCSFLPIRDDILTANERDRCVSRFLRCRLTRGHARHSGRMVVSFVGGGDRSGFCYGSNSPSTNGMIG